MNRYFLLIPRIQIHNANALSSPYTIGFPAITAWMGAVHALERRLRLRDEGNQRATAYFESLDYEEALEDLRFNSVAVVCHDISMHTYRGENDYVSSIVGTGNPLDKYGKRPSFIEEARCDLMASLLIEYEIDDNSELLEVVSHVLGSGMKIAGGDVIRFGKLDLLSSNDAEAHTHQSLMARLMPGYCLIERSDLMRAAMQDGQDAMDALLDYLKVSYSCYAEDEKVIWSAGARKSKGWIVPIATGFHGVSDRLGIAELQRDPSTPHRFVESVVTLGEFIMPYRITDVDHILWHYAYDDDNQLYLCKPNQPYSNLSDPDSLNLKEIVHG